MDKKPNDNYFGKQIRKQHSIDFNKTKGRILTSGRPVCLSTGMINPIKLNISEETLAKLKKEE